MKNERGIFLAETIAALAILSIVVVALLSGVATASKATAVTNEQTIAESLVRSEIEYVKNYAYQSFPATYPVKPGMNIPWSWNVPAPTTEKVHVTDDGIQRVTVTAQHNGETILSVNIYKVNR